MAMFRSTHIGPILTGSICGVHKSSEHHVLIDIAVNSTGFMLSSTIISLPKVVIAKNHVGYSQIVQHQRKNRPI
jgi:hypothetical protein